MTELYVTLRVKLLMLTIIRTARAGHFFVLMVSLLAGESLTVHSLRTSILQAGDGCNNGEYNMQLRLDKYLCDMQEGTRSTVKDMIRKKKVSVNGTIVVRPELKVNTDNDIVCVDGRQVGYSDYEYYMLNKPQGVVSATSDLNDKTVIDIIADRKRKDLFPVGRLDKDTEGLLIITNDGELAHRLLSPKHHVDKVYEAIVKGKIADKYVEEFAKGLYVDSEFTAMPAELKIISYDDNSDSTHINITIREGKYHQIKRMFTAIGSEVLFLKRLSMGGITLDRKLTTGSYRVLTDDEIAILKDF